jgi:hypothetical protein
MTIVQTGLFNDEAHQSDGERVESDYYPTPTGLSRSLLQNVPQLPDLCFEPCAGQGAITEVLRESGRDVEESDILWEVGPWKHNDATDRNAWVEWAGHMDSITPNWATITNPPFSLAAEILPLAYEYSPWGVAFLLRLTYLEPTENRSNWLIEQADNLRYVIPVNPRPCFRRDKKGGDSCTVAWMVWQKSWSWKSLGIRCPFIFEPGWKNNDKTISRPRP